MGQIGLGRGDRDLGAEVEDLVDAIGVVEHLHEDVRTHQMAGEGEGAGDQAVEGDLVAEGLARLARHLEADREAALVDAEGGQVGQLPGLQRMADHRRRHVLGPMQLAAQDLGLDLEVEDEGQAVSLIPLPRLDQAGDDEIGRLQHRIGANAFEFAAVHANEGHPGDALHGLAGHSIEDELTASGHGWVS